MKIKGKMLLGSSLLALVPVLLTSIILSTVSVDYSSNALEAQVQSQLVSLRETKKDQIEGYFQTVESQVLNMAASNATRELLREMPAAAAELMDEHYHQLAGMRQHVGEFYQREFANEFRKQNPGQTLDTTVLVRGMGDVAVLLQYLYLSNNRYPMGEKNKLVSLGNGSSYDALHGSTHPFLDDFVERFGYYDLFLVDTRGDMLYSVFKEVDFATNLRNGPYADSGIARVFNRAMSAAEGQIVVEDFAPYLPSYNGAASFAAAPVFEHGKRLGVLIVQMPIDEINAIMTSGGLWADVGLGESGETYLLGQDRLARSMSRFLMEDPNGYLAMLRQLNVPRATVDMIAARQTNIGLQTIDTEGSRAALRGETGFAIFPDYRGVEVLSAYTPLNITGLNWVLMSEIDKDEAFAAVVEMRSNIIIWALVVTIAVFLFALAAGALFSNQITRPVLRLVHTIEEIEQNSDLSRRIEHKAKDELGDMARSFNRMLEKLHHSMREVSGSTSQLAAAAEELSAITQETTRAVETQRSETEQVATAMHEMTATVQEVASSATRAANAAQGADGAARKGSSVVSQTVDSIKHLADDVRATSVVINKLEVEANNIGTVLDVIQGIAEQTNLLALNAAIEAARAGEQGRGFAVVADEVRSLASRTQDSTSEIKQIIDTLQAEARKAVEAMRKGEERAGDGVDKAAQAGSALAEITKAVGSINDMNAQIASAAEEQGAVAEEINRNVNNISMVAEQNTETSAQTSRASEELAHLATELQALVAQFKL